MLPQAEIPTGDLSDGHSQHGRAAAFFDRDGTLNVDQGYVHRIEDFEWIEGAREAILHVQNLGYLPIVVTNQSGIARGLYSEAQAQALHHWMNEDLQSIGASIHAFYMCPFLPDAPVSAYAAADHPDRKPNPGMLLKAIAEHGLSPDASFIVGDQERDLEAGRRAGVHGFHFKGGNLARFLQASLMSIDK